MKTFSLGEKLKQMREAKGISQVKLAEAIAYSASRLSQIENDECPCQPDVLMAIKKALNLEGVPLYDVERQGFKDKLYRWHSIISNGDIENASTMQAKLSDITYLPFDTELNALYNLFRCRMLLTARDTNAATDILQNFEPLLPTLSSEVLYHYYYSMGLLCHITMRRKDALEYYLQAKPHMMYGFEGNAVLQYNIATCLSNLGYIVASILFLEDVRNIYAGGQVANISLRIDSMIGLGLIQLGQLAKAKIVLEKCYREAAEANDCTMLGITLHNFGCLYRKAGDWNMSMEYLNQAQFPKNSTNYLENLYQRTLCLVDMKCYAPCAELIAEGKEFSSGNKSYEILFRSVECIISSDSKAIEYLENVTLPHFLGIGENMTALDFCEFLREYFDKKGIVKKSGQMSEIARRIYKDMHGNPL